MEKLNLNCFEVIRNLKSVDRNEWVMEAAKAVFNQELIVIMSDRPSICYSNVISDMTQQKDFEDALAKAMNKDNSLLNECFIRECEAQLSNAANDYEIGR